jgi:hypothetical protein
MKKDQRDTYRDNVRDTLGVHSSAADTYDGRSAAGRLQLAGNVVAGRLGICRLQLDCWAAATRRMDVGNAAAGRLSVGRASAPQLVRVVIRRLGDMIGGCLTLFLFPLLASLMEQFFSFFVSFDGAISFIPL